MVNYRQDDQDIVVEKVQVTDLENVAYLPKPRCIKGMLAGNDNWRSPEGHFKGKLNKPTDLYSFGLTVSIGIEQRPSTTNLTSAFTQCSAVSFLDRMITSNSTNRKAHFLL